MRVRGTEIEEDDKKSKDRMERKTEDGYIMEQKQQTDRQKARQMFLPIFSRLFFHPFPASPDRQIMTACRK